jgi:hypothetical protein
MTPDYLKGIIIGFSIAAPVGPIEVLTIKRTLAKGRLQALLQEWIQLWLILFTGSLLVLDFI